MKCAVAKLPAKASVDIAKRVDAVDWPRVAADLDAQGWAMVEKLLEPD